MIDDAVCGFLFTQDRKEVAMVLKTRTVAQAGRYNGPGGKIEPGETPHQAMVREFEEEVGVHVPEWEHFATLSVTSIQKRILFYRAFWSEPEKPQLQMLTDELPRWIGVDNEFDIYADHVAWLIRKALTHTEARILQLQAC